MCRIDPGVFCFIPPGVPHIAFNLSDTEPALAVSCRNDSIEQENFEERIFPIFPWFPPDDAILDAAGWQRVLAHMLELEPDIVVPGHGSIGGAEILVAVSNYMDEVSAAVGQALRQGVPDAQMVERLAPGIRAAHPDWDAPEWIDFAIRYYADTMKDRAEAGR